MPNGAVGLGGALAWLTAWGDIALVTGLPESHEWRPDQLRRAITAAGVALWAWNVDTDGFSMDELGFKLWGLPEGDTVTFEQLSARIHPADRDRVRSAFTATRAILGPY